jgi:hypothetical protein
MGSALDRVFGWFLTFFVAPITQPSGCVCSHENIIWVSNKMRFGTRGLLIVYAWETISLRALVGLNSAESASKVFVCIWTCEITIYKSLVKKSDVRLHLLHFVRKQIWGLMGRTNTESFWSERLCIVRCPIGDGSIRDQKHVIPGHFVNEGASYKFCD